MNKKELGAELSVSIISFEKSGIIQQLGTDGHRPKTNAATLIGGAHLTMIAADC